MGTCRFPRLQKEKLRHRALKFLYSQSHGLDISELGFVPRLGALQPAALTHTLCCSGPGEWVRSKGLGRGIVLRVGGLGHHTEVLGSLGGLLSGRKTPVGWEA